MKLLCTQENLNSGLFIVSHIPSKTTNLPILNNVLIKAEDNIIKLHATNLEMGISCNVRGKVEKSGSYTIQAKLLSDYINLLPKEKVELELVEGKDEPNTNHLKIKCNNYSTKIKGLSASEFPLIPQIEKKNPYVCATDDLRLAISQVIFAVSISETRPEISGVLMNFTENSLTLAATDSFRLAEKTIKLISGHINQKLILPAKTLHELLRILNSFKDPVNLETIKNIEIYASDNQILFVVGGVELISRLIEGQYPDYKQIIPQNFVTTVEITTGELVKVIKTASLFTRNGIYDVILNFDVNNKEVLIASSNTQVGENKSKISAKIEGKANDIVLNYRFLLDGLQNIDSPEVVMHIISNSNPCIIKPKEMANYTYIIMPIKQ